MQINHNYTHTHTHAPTHRPPLLQSHPSVAAKSDHRKVPGWAPCVIYQLPTNYFAHDSVYISMLLSQFVPPSPRVHKPILYICIFIPSLQMGSSVPFFQIPYIHVNIQYLYFSF